MPPRALANAAWMIDARDSCVVGGPSIAHPSLLTATLAAAQVGADAMVHACGAASAIGGRLPADTSYLPIDEV